METFREDYFQFLPFETIEEIFLLLDPILASWPILARVSKEFYRVSGTSKRLWRSVRIEHGAHSCKACNREPSSTKKTRRPKFGRRALRSLTARSVSGQIRELELSNYKASFPLTTLHHEMFQSIEKLCLRNFELDESSELMMSLELPHLRELNLMNLACTRFFTSVTAPRLEVLILSGVRNILSAQIVSFILKSKETLRQLDISRTTLTEQDIELVLDECQHLEVVVGTEMRWRIKEEEFAVKYPRTKVILRLLSHWLEPIKKRRGDVACLYDIDGRGCSLLADAIYVGIKLDVIRYMIDEFNMDVNRHGCLPDPWMLPYPTKIVESYEQMRSPLGFHQAVLLNKLDIASLLLDRGADPNLVSPDGNSALAAVLETPIMDATARIGAVGFLLRCNAAIDSRIVKMAVIDRQLPDNLLLSMVELVGSKDVLDKFLWYTASKDRCDVVKLLLERGASPSFINCQSSNDNVLVNTIKQARINSVRVILQSGGEEVSDAILRRDASGWTAIHHAILHLPLDYFNGAVQSMADKISQAGELPFWSLGLPDFCRHNVLLADMKDRLAVLESVFTSS